MAEPWGLQDVSVAFGTRVVLRDVTVQVSPGQIVAVVLPDMPPRCPPGFPMKSMRYSMSALCSSTIAAGASSPP